MATAALGLWQYSVAHRDDVFKQVLAAPAVAVAQLVQPGQFLSESVYGRRVTAIGTVEPERCADYQDAVTAQAGIVCPVLTDGEWVAVLLPFRPSAGDFETVGRLQPAQTAFGATARYAPGPVIDLISTAELANRWQRDVADGFVVSDDMGWQQSQLLWPPAGIALRNLLYAWQWWIFAAFALFIWGRYLRDEYLGAKA